MIKSQKTARENRKSRDITNPSFSSTLLDEIYRSIDSGGENSKFHRETLSIRKQSESCGKTHRSIEEEKEIASLRRACLIEKWMDKQVSQKVSTQQKQYVPEFARKSNHDPDRDRDQDALFFSSTSFSSDSSFGGFSSSDTESMHGAKSSTPSCFGPLRAKVKPVRTRIENPERKQKTLFELHMFDDYRRQNATERNPTNEECIIKSKSRALKIYSNLKKVKQPISPGGRLSTFLNSLFTTGNTKKTKTPSSSIEGYVSRERNCSSASSFSRSCLSKQSLSSSREKMDDNGVKRTVRFYPVSVILDEDCRPCGEKCLYEEDNSSLMDVSVQLPTVWKVEHSPAKMAEGEKRKYVKKKAWHDDEEEEDDDDDADDGMSCSSSDLFELDHRVVMELPVYETTHVNTNRAIANSLLI